jgi:uncharacterized membrane protein YadS
MDRLNRLPVPVRFLFGFAFVILLALAAWNLTQNVYAIKLPGGIPGKTLEYPLWAALVGLLGNFALRVFKLHEFVRPGIRTELFLKIGLVLLGTGISLPTILTMSTGAVLQTLILVPSVFFFCWWLAGRFGLDEKLKAIMSAAVSICGVSAAIAASGSVQAKKEQVTYITTLVIIVALPMMVLAPLLAGWMGLPEGVAGAWFGGNIDNTAAVVGAGTLYGAEAQKMASVVKSAQNVLIGVVAFLLAVYIAVHQPDQTRPSARVIWDRFPKFVLGFILASILYSLGQVEIPEGHFLAPVFALLSHIDGSKGTTLDALKSWAFTLAFVCMGLDLTIKDFRSMGWRPVIVFLLVTVFNTVLALGTAWAIFTYLFPVGG